MRMSQEANSWRHGHCE